MKGARGLLISITGGNDLTLYEVDEAASRIREEVDEDANIILGATFDESLDGIMRVSVVATGIDTPTPREIAAAESRIAEATQKLRSQVAAAAAPAAAPAPAPRAEPAAYEQAYEQPAAPAYAAQEEQHYSAPQPTPLRAAAPGRPRGHDRADPAEGASEPARRRRPQPAARARLRGRPAFHAAGPRARGARRAHAHDRRPAGARPGDPRGPAGRRRSAPNQRRRSLLERLAAFSLRGRKTPRRRRLSPRRLPPRRRLRPVRGRRCLRSPRRPSGRSPAPCTPNTPAARRRPPRRSASSSSTSMAGRLRSAARRGRPSRDSGLPAAAIELKSTRAASHQSPAPASGAGPYLFEILTKSYAYHHGSARV